MMRTLSAILALSLAACSGEDAPPAATQTIVISEPETVARAITVRRFVVTPEAMSSGQPATARVELATPDPSRQLALEWYGPDGWLISYELHAAEPSFDVSAPIRLFEQSGRHRAVLRSGRIALAEREVLFVK